jgi:NAD(P)-dependent dehydrogenase (short-subunit alcohol dehydrogenase family)
MSLADKRVLVTGGGSGIGSGIARAMANEGCRVVICGRRQSALDQVAQSIQSQHPVLTHPCDVASRKQVQDLFSWLKEQELEPDILVNCAGTNVPKRAFNDLSPEDFDRVLAINTTGTFNIFHAALPAMRQRRDGLIINVVSVAGRRVFPLAGVPYSASKFAQAAIGSFANFEVAEEGVRITNIYPGEVNTPILDQRPQVPPPELRARMLQPEDFGDLAITIARLPARALVSEIVITPSYMPQP